MTYGRRLARLTATLTRFGLCDAHNFAPGRSGSPPSRKMTMSASLPCAVWRVPAVSRLDANRLLSLERQGEDGLELERVTHRHDAPGPPDGSHRLLRSGLAGLIDEQPCQRLSADVGEKTS